MPSHFDRFRYLNGSNKFVNESDKFVYVRAEEEDPPLEVPPHTEVDVPPSGQVIIEVKTELPE